MLQPCLEQLDISKSTILAEKAYGSKENRQYITDKKSKYCIPPKANTRQPWDCDYYHYKERHVVENFFMRIKDNRRIATRYEELARRYMGCVLLAASILWLA